MSLDQLQDTTVGELIGFFQGPKALRDSEPAVTTAKLAVASLSAVGRIKATERAAQGMKLTIIKMISNNSEEAQKYAQATVPELTPKKLLPKPKKK